MIDCAYCLCHPKSLQPFLIGSAVYRVTVVRAQKVNKECLEFMSRIPLRAQTTNAHLHKLSTLFQPHLLSCMRKIRQKDMAKQ